MSRLLFLFTLSHAHAHHDAGPGRRDRQAADDQRRHPGGRRRGDPPLRHRRPRAGPDLHRRRDGMVVRPGSDVGAGVRDRLPLGHLQGRQPGPRGTAGRRLHHRPLRPQRPHGPQRLGPGRPPIRQRLCRRGGRSQGRQAGTPGSGLWFAVGGFRRIYREAVGFPATRSRQRTKRSVPKS